MTSKILVATGNFRLYYKIKNSLQNRFVIIHKLKVEKDDNFDLIIFEGTKQTPGGNSVYLSEKMNVLEIQSRIYQALVRSTNAIQCIVGIDPGVTTGVAILQDGFLIATNVFYTIDPMISWLRRTLSSLLTHDLKFRVGDGGGKIHHSIVERLKKEFTDQVVIEIVDESNTSIRVSNSKTRHEEAAIIIAHREGSVL